MRTYVEIQADARGGSPFSNGTSGAIWTSAWCDRCLRDKAMRDGTETADPDSGIVGCPLLAVALLGQTPVEWFEQGMQDYHCIEFRNEDDGPGGEPQPIPDPPGMDALLPREPYTTPLMFTANVEQPAGVGA